MPLQSLLGVFWKRYRLWLLGSLVCGWSLCISAAWWLMDSAGYASNGVHELLQIGALPVT